MDVFIFYLRNLFIYLFICLFIYLFILCLSSDTNIKSEYLQEGLKGKSNFVQ